MYGFYVDIRFSFSKYPRVGLLGHGVVYVELYRKPPNSLPFPAGPHLGHGARPACSCTVAVVQVPVACVVAGVKLLLCPLVLPVSSLGQVWSGLLHFLVGLLSFLCVFWIQVMCEYFLPIFS